jgi:hypothetical protein
LTGRGGPYIEPPKPCAKGFKKLIATTDGTKEWRRSTYCSDSHCVEVTVDGDFVLMRDTKNTEQPHLGFERDSWAHFVAEVKDGHFQSI